MAITTIGSTNTQINADLAEKAPIASPTFTGASTFSGTITASSTINEKFYTTGTVVASGATYNLDTSLGSVWSNTTAGNQTNNFTLNIRNSSSTTYMSTIPVGYSSTVTFMFTTGSTAVGPTTFKVDGTSVAPWFLNGLYTYGVNCLNVVTITTLNLLGSANLYVSISKYGA